MLSLCVGIPFIILFSGFVFAVHQMKPVIRKWMLANPNGKVEWLQHFLKEYHRKINFEKKQGDEDDEDEIDEEEEENDEEICPADEHEKEKISSNSIKHERERSGIFPLNPDAVLGSKMIQPDIEGLPAPPPRRRTRKRGAARAPGDIVVNRAEIINANPQPPKKPKKKTKISNDEFIEHLKSLGEANNLKK
jgi:hypothetical protein